MTAIKSGMMAASGRPMSLSLAQGLNTCGWRAVLNKIEQVNADGMVMRGQVAPRPIGILMGLTTTISPFMTHKAYKEIAHLPVPAEVKEIYKNEVLEFGPGYILPKQFDPRLCDHMVRGLKQAIHKQKQSG